VLFGKIQSSFTIGQQSVRVNIQTSSPQIPQTKQTLQQFHSRASEWWCRWGKGRCRKESCGCRRSAHPKRARITYVFATAKIAGGGTIVETVESNQFERRWQAQVHLKRHILLDCFPFEKIFQNLPPMVQKNLRNVLITAHTRKGINFVYSEKPLYHCRITP
jgi:hypothetical protein